MIIKHIALENIRSYKKEEVEFPEGSIVLSGDIGSGKTTILLAIEFALFGLQPGQKGSSLLRYGEDGGKVRLKFEVGGRELDVERGLERKGDSVRQSTSKIKIDNREEEMSTAELKNKVLALLNYPKEFARKTNILYRFTVYTPQEEMKQIIKEKPEARLNTLRHIFGINKYKKVRENTELYTKRIRKKIRSLEGSVHDLADIKKSKEEKEENVRELKKEIGKLETGLKEQEAQREEFEKSVKEVEKKQEEKNNYERERDKIQVRIQGVNENLESKKNEKENLKNQISEAKKADFKPELFEKTVKDLEKKEEEIENENKKFMGIMSNIKSLNSKIEEAESLKERIASLKLCPTCLQDVEEGYKKNILRSKDDEIEGNKRKINTLEEKKQESINIIEKKKDEMKNLREKRDELNMIKIKLESAKEKEERLENIENEIKQTEKDSELLKTQIKKLSEYISSLKKYDQLVESKKKELEKLKSKEQEIRINVASKRKEKDMTLDRIEEIKREIKKKENILEELKQLGEVEDWLSSSFLDIVSYTERNILLKLREEFSKLFNEWFNILVPEEFNVSLDEDFTPIIEQKDYELDYDFLSGGERTAVALAYRLSLNHVINSLLSKIKTRNLVILDEPTDGFSEQQLDKMRDVLNELDAKQLIIVSHEDKIESFVENIIKFSKNEEVTKVENRTVDKNKG